MEQAGVAVPDASPDPAFQWLPATPNPFRESVALRFVLPRRMAVRLEVFDLAGRVVAILADGPLEAGDHLVRWNGREDRAGNAPAGLYFARFDAAGIHERHKLVLAR